MKRDLLTSNRTLAAAAALLAPVAVALAVPAAHTGGVPVARAADTAPADDLTNDGTQPDPPPPADPGPGTFDDLSNDGTQPDPPAPADPGPGTPDDLTNEGSPPTAPPPADPGPGTFDDLTNEAAPPTAPATPPPAGTPPATTGPGGQTLPNTPNGGTPPPGQTGPNSVRARRPSLRLKVSSRVTRRRLRRGLAVRLTTKAPLHVVVKLRGPGRHHTRRVVTLKPGTRRLVLHPHGARSAKAGRKVVLVLTATTSDGTRITRHRTIRIRR